MRHAPSGYLPRFAQLLWLLLWVGLGLVPSFLFFAWTERGAALPEVPLYLHWPWVDLRGENLALICAWNVGLFLLFGLVHSLTAQKSFQTLTARHIPLQAVRALYVMIAGVSVLTMMGFWQSTGIVLWNPLGHFGVSSTWITTLSLLLYWGFLALASASIVRGEGAGFFGLTQIFQSTEELQAPRPPQALRTDGFYGYVRHPLYTGVLLAILVTPVMTLDRFLIFAAHLLYLSFGLPMEERKLVAEFGDAYRAYQKHTPALIPGLF